SRGDAVSLDFAPITTIGDGSILAVAVARATVAATTSPDLVFLDLARVEALGLVEHRVEHLVDRLHVTAAAQRVDPRDHEILQVRAVEPAGLERLDGLGDQVV